MRNYIPNIPGISKFRFLELQAIAHQLDGMKEIVTDEDYSAEYKAMMQRRILKIDDAIQEACCNNEEIIPLLADVVSRDKSLRSMENRGPCSVSQLQALKKRFYIVLDKKF